MAESMARKPGNLPDRPRRALTGRVLLDAFAQAILVIASFIFGFFWWSIRWSLAVVVFLAVMAAAGYWVFSEAVAGGTYVDVPSVVGMDMLEAKYKIEDSGLDVQERFVENEEFPEYTVIGQRPQPGNVVREGRPVNLTIATAHKFIAVPDYVGKTKTAVQEELSASSDFSIADTVEIPSERPAGEILAQDPPYTGEAASSNEVSLLVSEGLPIGDLRMPNVKSMEIAKAVAELTNKGINARIEVAGDEDDPVGVVLSQVPDPGMELAEGVAVILRYKRDPEEPEELPETAATPGMIDVTVSYVLPHAWYDREVRIDVIGNDGLRRTVFPLFDLYVNGAPPRYTAGTEIKQPLEYENSMVVEVFLDNRLARTYRYGPDGQAQIMDSGDI